MDDEKASQAEMPLAGTKIVVTRARHQADGLAARFERFGATVILFPTIEIRPADEVVRIKAPQAFDWIVFASANAVRMFRNLLESNAMSFSDFEGVKICAVGPATAEKARENGLDVALVPEEFIAESVLEALLAKERRLEGKRFLMPKGDIGRAFLADELRAAGAGVEELVVYRTVLPEVGPESADTLLEDSPDVVTFTSGSTARNFCRIVGHERLLRLKATTQFASIGPSTTGTALEEGLTIAIEARVHDSDSLVDAVADWARRL